MYGVGDVVSTFAAADGSGDLSGTLGDGGDRSLLRGAHGVLELGEGLFDRVARRPRLLMKRRDPKVSLLFAAAPLGFPWLYAPLPMSCAELVALRAPVFCRMRGLRY